MPLDGRTHNDAVFYVVYTEIKESKGLYTQKKYQARAQGAQGLTLYALEEGWESNSDSLRDLLGCPAKTDGSSWLPSGKPFLKLGLKLRVPTHPPPNLTTQQTKWYDFWEL